MPKTTGGRSEQTYELNGRLVAPKSETKSTFEEFIAARRMYLEINREALWNPWVREDRASEELAAVMVTSIQEHPENVNPYQ